MNVRSKLLLEGASALCLGIGVGAAAGFYVAKKKLETQYAALATKEIADAKKFYTTLYKKDDFATPQSAVDALVSDEDLEVLETEAINDYRANQADAAEALQNYQGFKNDPADIVVNKPVFIPDEDVVVVNNVFVNSKPMDNDDFNYEEELKHRSPEAPYIISLDEYNEAERDYEQSTLTYYSGDDVLADERDEVIPDSDATVGDENLLHFGRGSGDSHVVYVRNDRIQIDFEVVASRGKFTEEVLGFIQHDDNRNRIRRFRGDDE